MMSAVSSQTIFDSHAKQAAATPTEKKAEDPKPASASAGHWDVFRASDQKAEAKPATYNGPKLRLVYFHLAGRAEPIRWTLTLGDVPFEDQRISREEFKRLADQAEFAYSTVPVLYVGDQQIGQSVSALRFAGKLAGLYPSDPLIAGQIDAVVDLCSEFTVKMLPAMFAPDEAKKAIRLELAKTALEYFNYFEHALKRNTTSSGYYQELLSIGDIVSALVNNRYLDGALDPIPTTIMDPFPRLKAHTQAIFQLPKIAAWIAAHK